MDEVTIPPELEEILARKEARRKRLAALPWPEKIKIVVELQKRFAPIYRARGIDYHVWRLEGEESSENQGEGEG